MNKKLLGTVSTIIILAAVGYLVFSSVTTRVESEKNDVVIAIVDGQAEAGETVNLGAELKDVLDSEIAGLEIDLSYDGDIFLEPEVVGTDVLEKAGKTVSSSVIRKGLFKILVIGINRNEIESGRILDIAFKINPNAQAGQYSVNIDKIVAATPDADSIDISIENGIIEIVQ